MEKEKMIYRIACIITLFILLPCSVMATEPVIRFARGNAPSWVKERISRNVCSFISSLPRSEKPISIHANDKKSHKLLESNTIIFEDLDSLYDCNKTKIGYEVRGLKVKQKLNDSTYIDKQLTIGISSEGEIASVSFSIDNRMYDNLFSRDYASLMQDSNDSISYEDEMIALENKKAIVDFIEQYQTSYANKDEQFLYNLFSEDALIITGSTIRRSAQNTYFDKPQIAYAKQSKLDYIYELQRKFRKEEVDIQISDIEITRHPKNKEIYGVTIVQQCKTCNYRDDKTLFFIIDMHSDFRVIVKRFVPKGEKLDLYDFAIP